MKDKFTIIVEKDEDGWLVSEVIGLPGCHTQAKDMNQLLIRTKEAIQAYISEEPKQKVYEQFIGVQQIEV
jgi:predicted RNase H-like HicB family nuclease